MIRIVRALEKLKSPINQKMIVWSSSLWETEMKNMIRAERKEPMITPASRRVCGMNLSVLSSKIKDGEDGQERSQEGSHREAQ